MSIIIIFATIRNYFVIKKIEIFYICPIGDNSLSSSVAAIISTFLLGHAIVINF